MKSSADLIRQARTDAPSATFPGRRHAIVACMDVRLDPLAAVSMRLGDAHVIRNAGGLITADVVRSLVISQRALRSHSIDIVMHTDCGMLGLDERALAAEIVADNPGASIPDFLGFSDLEAALRRGVERLRGAPALPHRDRIRGLVFDVVGGRTRVVVP
jgi:carbonic anhydrase